jgi:hypothetical protein
MLWSFPTHVLVRLRQRRQAGLDGGHRPGAELCFVAALNQKPIDCERQQMLRAVRGGRVGLGVHSPQKVPFSKYFTTVGMELFSMPIAETQGASEPALCKLVQQSRDDSL